MKKICLMILSLALLSLLLISCADGEAQENGSSETSIESTLDYSALSDTSDDTSETIGTEGSSESEASIDSIVGGDEFANDNEAHYKDEWN